MQDLVANSKRGNGGLGALPATPRRLACVRCFGGSPAVETGLPVHADDFFHDLDFDVPSGDDLLEAPVLLLELPQPFDVRRVEFPR